MSSLYFTYHFKMSINAKIVRTIDKDKKFGTTQNCVRLRGGKQFPPQLITLRPMALAINKLKPTH